MKTIKQVIQSIDEGRSSLEFLPTGFSILDRLLDGGLLKKEVIVIGGSTGIGKSFFSAQIAYNVARKGFKTAYFSLEISSEMLVSRLLGQLANIKATKIVSGELNAIDHEKRIRAQGKLISVESLMDIYDDMYEYKQIYAAIEQGGYSFVVIDFIQNVMIQGMEEYPKLNEITIGLQKLAKRLDCTILLLSQLSNTVSRDRKKEELVPEYKGSGSIAMVCDLGFFIVRDYSLNTIDLLLRKNRRGPSGLSFRYQFQEPGGFIYECPN